MGHSDMIYGLCFIIPGLPCGLCGNEIHDQKDKPTIIEMEEGQMIVHWDCIPEYVQKQINMNLQKQRAVWS